MFVVDRVFLKGARCPCEMDLEMAWGDKDLIYNLINLRIM